MLYSSPIGSGRCTVNTEPLLGSLSTDIKPPCSVIILSTMARPRPVPPVPLDLALSTR